MKLAALDRMGPIPSEMVSLAGCRRRYVYIVLTDIKLSQMKRSVMSHRDCITPTFTVHFCVRPGF